jgi:hypothetical protein
VQPDEAKQQTRWPYYPSETVSNLTTFANGIIAGRVHNRGVRQPPHRRKSNYLAGAQSSERMPVLLPGGVLRCKLAAPKNA